MRKNPCHRLGAATRLRVGGGAFAYSPFFCRSVMLSVLSADIRWCLVAGRRGRVRAREEVGEEGAGGGKTDLVKKLATLLSCPALN